MKTKFASFWWLLAAISCLCLLFCVYVGLYALANVVIFGAALYTLHLAKARRTRIEQSISVKKKLTKKEKRVLQSMEDKESKNIRSLAQMMPYLCFGALLLNGYTFYYNFNLDRFALPSFCAGLEPAAMVLLVIGLACGAAWYFAWCLRMNALLSFDEAKN